MDECLLAFKGRPLPNGGVPRKGMAEWYKVNDDLHHDMVVNTHLYRSGSADVFFFLRLFAERVGRGVCWETDWINDAFDGYSGVRLSRNECARMCVQNDKGTGFGYYLVYRYLHSMDKTHLQTALSLGWWQSFYEGAALSDDPAEIRRLCEKAWEAGDRNIMQRAARSVLGSKPLRDDIALSWARACFRWGVTLMSLESTLLLHDWGRCSTKEGLDDLILSLKMLESRVNEKHARPHLYRAIDRIFNAIDDSVCTLYGSGGPSRLYAIGEYLSTAHVYYDLFNSWKDKKDEGVCPSRSRYLWICLAMDYHKCRDEIARESTVAWCLVAKRIGINKDIRRVIAKLTWEWRRPEWEDIDSLHRFTFPAKRIAEDRRRSTQEEEEEEDKPVCACEVAWKRVQDQNYTKTSGKK